MPHSPRRWLGLAVGALALALAACGGGGGGGGDTAGPVGGPVGGPGPGPGPQAGLDSRPSNTTCIAGNVQGSGPLSVGVEEAFPDLPSFSQPVAMRQAPGRTDRWYVVEQEGRIQRFDNRPDADSVDEFVDIRGRVQSGGERGLLGMEFHPDFANNGDVFLSYTGSGTVSRIGRFQSDDGGLTLDAGSEVNVISVDQPFGNHNGGDLAFGPDGNLYYALGDGGSGGDPENNGQDTTTLLGAILRLDVDGGTPYAIPPGNPFSGSGSCATGCPEIYAWGFRNPWRMSFDTATGDLWAADVGQNAWEEVDLVVVGGNYGWRIREGAHCFNPSSGCSTAGLIDPVAEYDHSEGVSVTGGYVYRGSAIPGLVGAYVFGDFASGRIWGLLDDGQGGLERRLLVDTGLAIASFGQGADGEIYVIDYGGGTISKLVNTSPGAADPLPDQLSATGCVLSSNPLLPASGMIPYGVNAPAWDDGAAVERWFALPDGTTATQASDGHIDLPPGSMVMQLMRLGSRAVETRLFANHPDVGWRGYSYEWAADGSDATRMDSSRVEDIDGQPWTYPSSGECAACHQAVAGSTLALSVKQLNRDFTYPSTGRTADQLETYDAIGLFSSPLPGDPGTRPALANPYAAGVDPNDGSRAWLDVNCAHCHRPAGPTGRTVDLRSETPLEDTGTCDVPPVGTDAGIAGGVLIAPGEPDRSVLLARVATRGPEAMPSLVTLAVDDAGTALLDGWIDALNGCDGS